MNELPDSDAIKMFVGQVPKVWTEIDVRAHFEEFGRIYMVNVLRDKITKQSRGCCFITFYTRKSALDAQNACHNVRVLEGMSHPIQMKPADNENRHERKIFVGMITKSLNESDLRLLFLRFGLIEEVSILRDVNGVSRGCGFVTFASKASAINAIRNMHQSTIMDGCSSPLVVKIADTQRNNDKATKNQILQYPEHPSCSCPGSLPCNPFSPNAQQYTSAILQLLQQQQNSDSSLFQNPMRFGNTSILTAISTLNLLASGCLSPSITTAATSALLQGQPNLSNHLFSNSDDEKGNINSGNLPNFNPFHSPPGILNPSNNGRGPPMLNQSLPSPRNAQMEGPDGSNLFIYHLPQEFSDADLIQCFSPYGLIVSAKVFIDKSTNLSKCFGFVSYDNVLSAQLAINGLNGFQIGAKRLKVQIKRPKDKPY